MSTESCCIKGCEKTNLHAAGLCLMHYTRFRRYGSFDATQQVRGDDKSRLLKNVKKTESGCWEWQRFISADGYGKTFWNGRSTVAHRLSWQVMVGEIPAGMQVNHKCHNRLCCNPDHLYLGSQVDNMRDMIEAGRLKRPVGERSPFAKLTEQKVISIRASNESAAAMARALGVSPTLIRAVRQRKVWAHVP